MKTIISVGSCYTTTGTGDAKKTEKAACTKQEEACKG
jgi:hypothetical protein